MYDGFEEELDFKVWTASLRANKYAKAIPARALCGDGDSVGEWRRCEMLDWNEDENKFFM